MAAISAHLLPWICPANLIFLRASMVYQDRRLPYGRYVVLVNCANGGVSSTIQVDRPKRLLVVSSRQDIEYGHPPVLTVRVLGDVGKGRRPVWAKIVGVYLNTVDIEPVESKNSVALFTNPQPG